MAQFWLKLGEVELKCVIASTSALHILVFVFRIRFNRLFGLHNCLICDYSYRIHWPGPYPFLVLLICKWLCVNVKCVTCVNWS